MPRQKFHEMARSSWESKKKSSWMKSSKHGRFMIYLSGDTMDTYMYTNMCVYIYICIHINLDINMYLYFYIYIYIYMGFIHHQQGFHGKTPNCWGSSQQHGPSFHGPSLRGITMNSPRGQQILGHSFRMIFACHFFWITLIHLYRWEMWRISSFQ